MFKRLVAAFIMAFLVHATFPAGSLAAGKAATPPEKPAPPLVKVDKGRVSVEAKDAVLADLLNAIGKQAGVDVTIKSGGAHRVTQSFANMGLDDAIKTLAKGKDLVLVYSSATNRAGTNLAEVRLFAASAPGGRVVIDKGRSAQPQTADQTGEGQTVASLVSQLGDPDVAVRKAAARALARSSGRQLPVEAVGALWTATEDQDVGVRTMALVALAHWNEVAQPPDEASIAVMSQVLMRDPEVSVRQMAVGALSVRRTESARRAIEAAQSDADADVRETAAEALRQ